MLEAPGRDDCDKWEPNNEGFDQVLKMHDCDDEDLKHEDNDYWGRSETILWQYLD